MRPLILVLAAISGAMAMVEPEPPYFPGIAAALRSERGSAFVGRVMVEDKQDTRDRETLRGLLKVSGAMVAEVPLRGEIQRVSFSLARPSIFVPFRLTSAWDLLPDPAHGQRVLAVINGDAEIWWSGRHTVGHCQGVGLVRVPDAQTAAVAEGITAFLALQDRSPAGAAGAWRTSSNRHLRAILADQLWMQPEAIPVVAVAELTAWSLGRDQPHQLRVLAASEAARTIPQAASDPTATVALASALLDVYAENADHGQVRLAALTALSSLVSAGAAHLTEEVRKRLTEVLADRDRYSSRNRLRYPFQADGRQIMGWEAKEEMERVATQILTRLAAPARKP